MSEPTETEKQVENGIAAVIRRYGMESDLTFKQAVKILRRIEDWLWDEALHRWKKESSDEE